MKSGRWIKAMILSLMIGVMLLVTTATTNFEPASQSSTELPHSLSRLSDSTKPRTAHQTTESIPTIIPNGIEAWHSAGFTGTDVKIGVIDTEFGGLLQDLSTTQLARIQGYCFNQDRDVVTDSLAPCQETTLDTTGRTTGHGTRVLQTLMLIVPDALFYISNPLGTTETRDAIDWMQGQPVEVINASVGYPWQGPGDGTEIADRPQEFPIIQTANIAIAGGALWVNAAGNNQKSTWFKRNPRFPNNYLDMQGGSTSADACNEISLTEDDKPEFNLRWKDNWPTSDEAAGPATDLVLELFEQDGGQLSPTDGTRDQRQNGASDQYPIETMRFKVKETGTHCVKVKLKSGSAPSWVQMQETLSGAAFAYRPNGGEASIESPGESDNQGMLAVGATFIDQGTEKLLTGNTGYGPLPEGGYPNGPIKPDLVADGHLWKGFVPYEGTSYAAPKVAGLAAMIRQASSHQAEMDEPEEIAEYLRRHAVRPTGGSINQWGHGSATLPEPSASTDVTLEERGDIENLVVLSHTAGHWDGVEVKYLVRFWQKPDGTGPPQLKRSHFIESFDSHHSFLDPGFTYFATINTCATTATTEAGCSPPGRSNDLELPLYLDIPSNFSGHALVTSIRVQWTSVEGAAGYEVEQVESGITITTEYTDHPFRNLTAGETYTYRVRAVNGKWQSGWSTPVSITLPAPPEAPTITGNGLSNGRVQVTWTEPSGADTYKVRQCDRQAGQWQAHPYTEAGQTNVFTITTSGTTATIAGLTDGIIYTFRVGAANTDGTTWSEPIGTTAGTDPPATPQQSPGGLTCPSEGVPPSMLTLTLSGTEVTLTWTAATFNDITSQQVRRRTPGNKQWTDFTIGVTDTSWTDTSAVSGTSYIYRIQAKGPKTGENGRMSNRQVVSVP